jgi:hypothetical protein
LCLKSATTAGVVMSYYAKSVDKLLEQFAVFFGFKAAALGNGKNSLSVSVDNRSITVELGSLIGNKSLAKQVEKVKC